MPFRVTQALTQAIAQQQASGNDLLSLEVGGGTCFAPLRPHARLCWSCASTSVHQPRLLNFCSITRRPNLAQPCPLQNAAQTVAAFLNLPSTLGTGANIRMFQQRLDQIKSLFDQVKR